MIILFELNTYAAKAILHDRRLNASTIECIISIECI